MSRKKLREIDLETLLPIKDIAEALFQQFEKSGVKAKRDESRLRIKRGKELLPFDVDLITSSEDITVVYLDIISPNNARELGRKDGIVYYIGSNESKHFYEPHIHARIGDMKDKNAEVIRISMKDFSVEGSFKSCKEKKEAIQFVKEHLEEIRKEWNDLMESLGGPKWENQYPINKPLEKPSEMNVLPAQRQRRK